MIVIHKIELEIIDRQNIDLSSGFQVLDIQLQNDKFVLWAKLDIERDVKNVPIVCFFTGEPLPLNEMIYIKTIQHEGLVYHFFYLS